MSRSSKVTLSRDELDSLVTERARALIAEEKARTTVPPPASETGDFDEVSLTGDDGVTTRLSRQAFEKMPLDKRIRAILRKQVRFYLRGVEVSSTSALKRNY